MPGLAGKNIDQWLETKKLPKSLVPFNGKTKEEIFVCYEELKAKYGSEVDEMPLGAIDVYSFSQKLKVGLQQLRAGCRKFRLDLLCRDDLPFVFIMLFDLG